ncbi:PAS domain-containing protein [bacterium]|nr:PAS domain-containing protein [bacterium]
MYRKIIKRLMRYQKALNGEGPNSIFHSMQDNPIGTYLVKSTGEFVWCSDECREILGIPAYASIQKWNIQEFYYDPNHRRELLEKMAKNGQKLTKEIIAMRRHGSEKTPIYVEDYCRIVRQGSDRGYFGTLQDVTKSVSYHKLFDELSAGVFRLGKQGEFLMLNPAIPKILGEPATEDLTGRLFLDFWFVAGDYVQFIEQLQKENELVHYDAKLQRRDKQPVHVTITAKVWRDGNDNFLGYEGTITDITTEHKIVRTFENFSTGYFETQGHNQAHHIKFCNSSFAKMLGYDAPENLHGHPILDCFYSEAGRQAVTAQVQRIYEQKEKSFCKLLVQMSRKDGTPLWVQLDCVLHLDKREQIMGYEGMLVNVDDYQKAQIELARQRKLIEQNQTELDHKQEELDQNKIKVDTTLKDMDKFIHKFIAPMMNVDSTAQQLMHMLHIRFKMEPKEKTLPDRQANAVVNSLTKLISEFKLANIQSPSLVELETKKNQLASRKRLYRDPSLCDLWIREINMDIYELMTSLIRKIEPIVQDQHPIMEDTL